MTLWVGIGLLSLAVWLYLLVARGGFWLARERDDGVLASPSRWPAVVAVVPARNEADVIARSIGSLLAQDYPGPFRVVLVDDGSSDGTAAVACAERRRRATATPRRACRNGAAGGLDGQAVGAGAGDSPCHGRGRRRRLFPADRCRHRPCARQSQPARCARRARRPCPGLADGRAVLRERGRAFPHSRLRLFLPDALSLRLGRAARSQGGRRRRRLHAGPPRCAGARRRHRRHPVGDHRRLRAGASPQGRRGRSGSA